MKIEQAAQLLRSMIEAAPPGSRAVTVHLFGIRHVDQLQGMPLPELAERAGLTKAYGTEIRKGMNLATYVVPKGDASSRS